MTGPIKEAAASFAVAASLLLVMFFVVAFISDSPDDPYRHSPVAVKVTRP